MTVSVSKEDVAVCKVHGSLTPEAFIEGYDDAIALPDFEPGDPILFDFREASLSDLSVEDCRQMADHERGRMEERGSGRCALTVDSDLDYGVSRMLQAMREYAVEGSEIQVFRDLDAARDWLIGRRKDG